MKTINFLLMSSQFHSPISLTLIYKNCIFLLFKRINFLIFVQAQCCLPVISRIERWSKLMNTVVLTQQSGWIESRQHLNGLPTCICLKFRLLLLERKQKVFYKKETADKTLLVRTTKKNTYFYCTFMPVGYRIQKCCGTVTIVMVLVPTFDKLRFRLRIYCTIKSIFPKNIFVKYLAFLMLIEAALLPRNLSSHLLWLHFITVPVLAPVPES